LSITAAGISWRTMRSITRRISRWRAMAAAVSGSA
jgi:hypothetical protein